MSVELEEFAPGRWRVLKARHLAPVSELPLSFIISDIMPPTEQVDGRFYTSKAAFRKVGRQLGLIEIGTEKLTHKVVRASSTRAAKAARQNAIKKAMEKVRSS